MGDITLNVRGDGSEGAGAMREVGRAAGELDGATKKLGDSTKAAGESAKMSIADFVSLGGQIKGALGPVLDFAKQSIAAFEEQEKADRQLELATGDLADAYKAIASDMQSTLGVSDDMVERMITLAARYDTLPTQVEPATRAILDWAAATGGDAESGMQTLTRSIEFGQDKIKGLGIEFEGTGDKTKDLELAIAALTKKFGGAADGMADTLAGRTSKLTEAFGELKESLGGAFDTVDRGLGFTSTLATGFKNLSANISDFVQIAKNAANFGWGDWLAHGKGGALAPFEALASGTKQFDTDNNDFDPVDGVSAAGRITKSAFTNNKDDKKAEKAAEKLAKEKSAFDQINQFWASEDAETAARLLRNENAVKASNERLIAEAERANNKLIEEAESAQRKEVELLEKKTERWEQAQADQAERQLKADEVKAKAAEKAAKKLDDQLEAQNKKTEAMVANAATAIGMAFAGALAGALEEALSGGEVDAIGVAADIGFAVAAIAAATIANIYAPGTGTLVGGLIGTAGSVVHGVRARSFKQEQASRKHHDGGWIDSYHGGGWPGASTDEEMAMLQRGERVLSRSEVARMGGKGGVDAAARGGGGGRALHVTVVAQDAQGVREFFEDRGGRGIFNAVRTGRGQLSALLADG